MSNAERQLPEFERPPVSEVVISMGFTPIERWGIPHFGLFWQTIRTEYPQFEVHGPIRLPDEKFGPLSTPVDQPPLIQELDADQVVRCWFKNEPGTSLVQIQRDAFHGIGARSKDMNPIPVTSRCAPALRRIGPGSRSSSRKISSNSRASLSAS